MFLGERALPPAVEVLPGTDVDAVWERFEIFEALHHRMRICNPLTESEFDQIIEHIDLADGGRVLDVACGYGEVLLRCAEQAAIEGVGVDLSPWMLQAAQSRAEDLGLNAQLRWVLGEARDYDEDGSYDVAVCLGAEWIWHGFNGTARALARRIRPGGLVVIGAARLKDGCDPESVRASHGRVETVAEKEAMLATHGLRPIARFDPDDAGWDAYLARTRVSVNEWARRLPERRVDEYVAAQQEWIDARERDREIIGWSAWIATATG